MKQPLSMQGVSCHFFVGMPRGQGGMAASKAVVYPSPAYR